MVKDSLFETEVTAEEILRDLKRELDFFRKSVQISEELFQEEEKIRYSTEIGSIEHEQARSMGALYQARKSVYKETVKRLEDVLNCYIEE
jgi:hypothetical protein